MKAIRTSLDEVIQGCTAAEPPLLGVHEDVKVTIRGATPAESDTLTLIAHTAKRHWGYPEAWIRTWLCVLTLTPDFISNHPVFVATAEQEVVGFYALTGAPTQLRLEHLWVVPSRIGKGLGRGLFLHAAQTAVTLGAATIEIDSDPNAEGFYLRMGAKKAGEVWTEIEGQKRCLPRLIFEILTPTLSKRTRAAFR